jgi:hypothetical protein
MTITEYIEKMFNNILVKTNENKECKNVAVSDTSKFTDHFTFLYDIKYPIYSVVYLAFEKNTGKLIAIYDSTNFEPKKDQSNIVYYTETMNSKITSDIRLNLVLI